jgi:choline transport protein
MPISLILRKRILKEHIRFGPWRLGGLGMIANVVGLIYAIIGFFFSFWPRLGSSGCGEHELGLSGLGRAAMLFCSLWYLLRARHYYHGPIREIDDEG